MTHDSRGRYIAQVMMTELEKIAVSAADAALATARARYGRKIMSQAKQDFPFLKRLFNKRKRGAYKAEMKRGRQELAAGHQARYGGERKALERISKARTHEEADAAREALQRSLGIEIGKSGKKGTRSQVEYAFRTGKPGEQEGWVGRAAVKGLAGLGLGATGVGAGALYLKKKRQEEQQQFGGY